MGESAGLFRECESGGEEGGVLLDEEENAVEDIVVDGEGVEIFFGEWWGED